MKWCKRRRTSGRRCLPNMTAAGLERSLRVCGAPAFTLMYWLRKRRKEVEHNGAIAASTILYTITESCRCRDIESLRLPACRVHKVPSMTNCQVKHVTPEAWAKNCRSSATATAAWPGS
jgi:hypothetical protein